MQSRFLNDDEYLSLESDITSICRQPSYVCLTGEMNARTAVLNDSVLADPLIVDVLDFDQGTISYLTKLRHSLHLRSLSKEYQKILKRIIMVMCQR